MTGAPFRRVLVGWDGSADAAAALSMAATIVSADGGHVVALAVLPRAYHVEPADDETEGTGIRRRVEDDFQRAWQAAPTIRGARATLEVIENAKAGHAVCAYAEEHRFDVLVLGRHGTGGILRPRLGRVAEAAARDSAIPVLLVSQP